MTLSTMLRKPSAFLPILMSAMVVATELYFFRRFGIVHESDEGTAAHIFQILMAGQLPIIAYFAVRWLPAFPRPAIMVLLMQALAALAALAPVYYYKL
jgi:hypothetical protein